MKQTKPLLILLICTLTVIGTSAQSSKKDIKYLKKTLFYLADDKLEGRRTGTEGEMKAASFIEKQFIQNNIQSGFGETFQQTFEINEGLSIDSATLLKLGVRTFELQKEYFPLPYSKKTSIEIKNSNEDLVFYDIASLVSDNSSNPHFDLSEELYVKVKTIIEVNHPKAVLLFNSKDSATEIITFDSKDKKDAIPSIVIYCKKKIAEDIQASTSKQRLLYICVSIKQNIRIGRNVVGYIDNRAPFTVVVGAHYDHLGYGEDHNSLYVGKEKMVHNGADDNASGTAALLLLSKKLTQTKFKKYNYLLIAFSGEELGLYGSKFFTEHPSVDLKTVNYMINMDMVGRFNDSTRGLTLGGYGTSPSWGELTKQSGSNPYFNIKIDSAGSGPSDHTSFYRKDIPVLFFFTGTHGDYHKPSDDANKINFNGISDIVSYVENIILKTAALNKLSFSKTRESNTMGKSSFKVTLGIMPDYTFSGEGVLIDGISDNKPAQKAGLKTGDIIHQLGDWKVTDVQSYMQALNKFNKGETTTIKIERNQQLIDVKVTF